MALRPIESVAQLQEYSCVDQEPWHSDHPERVLKLDWNESPSVCQTVKERLAEFLNRPGAINWYPDVEARDLVQKIAAFVKCPPGLILPFAGSDAALETICKTYLSPGDIAVAVHPGYDHFRVYAQSCGGRVFHVVPGDDPLAFSAPAFIEKTKRIEAPKLIYLINPNNPVGYSIRNDDLLSIIKAFPETGVVLDEAYIEFFDINASSVPLTSRYDNLIVCRSFSKAFGLAGLRLGYVISDKGNLAHLGKVRNPNSVSMFAQIAGSALLENFHAIAEHIERVREGRDWFAESYRKMGGVAISGEANFVLVAVSKPEEVIRSLRQRRIFVRDRSHVQGMAGMIRITAGYRDVMQRVLGAFESIPACFWRLDTHDYAPKAGESAPDFSSVPVK